MSIEINGIDKLLSQFEKIVDINEMEKKVGTACAMVEAQAKKNAPRDTGELRRSIQSKVEIDGNNINGVVFTPLEYAPYIEYGTGLFAESGGRKDTPWSYKDDKGEWHSTSGQKPKPYLRPAFNDNRKRILEIIKEGVLND
ncbi:MAG: HK97 gp10 family phage protein [Bacilli bacterium]|nr:HK97 gp10 family phage protein [Bacilli bacterium]